MQAIAQELQDLPMVLKGGTALLLCYGLDRFSEDLDFDSPKKFNITNRVERILSRYALERSAKIVKETETVQRIKAHYKTKIGERLLKIETSFRSPPENDRTIVINGIKTYKISTLIDQKLSALLNRTAARDLYDVAFLVKNYWKEFSPAAKEKLSEATKDLDALEKRFEEAFFDDEIIADKDLQTIILTLAEKS